MAENKDEMVLKKWAAWNDFQNKVIKLGLETGSIRLYNENEILRARNFYLDGIPLSISLLCFFMCNGRCHELSLAVARMFLDDPETKEVSILIGNVNSLKFNPTYADSTNEDDAHHLVVYRETTSGEKMIYDTTCGLVFRPDIWMKMEMPTNFHKFTKEGIQMMVSDKEKEDPNIFKGDLMHAFLIIPMIEECYGKPDEQYSNKGFEVLQDEVETFKKYSGYNEYYKAHQTEVDTLRKIYRDSKKADEQ
ncbi:MAG: hypothetical protein IKP98_04225 [Bacilli bacterium]|nr:hypothetical protein [Bacilli bacterium]